MAREILSSPSASGTLLRLVLPALVAPLLLNSCAVVGEPPVGPPPPESRFVRHVIPIAGTDRTYPVWRTRAAGRPVLLLHALNGLSPDLLKFALELETWGYRVYLPSLYGDPIGDESAFGYDKELSSIRLLRESGTWNPVSTESTGPIIEDAAVMARWVSRREGGQSLAVIGNSITGGFPLALLDEPCVGLAVLGQPALPARRLGEVMLRIPQGEKKRRSLTVTEEKWASIVSAMRKSPGKRLVGFHYFQDPMGAIERFDELHERLAGEGLAARFTAYVMLPPDSRDAAERRDWLVPGETGERRTMTTPHSTFLDAENELDRAWFRSRLRKALARSW